MHDIQTPVDINEDIDKQGDTCESSESDVNLPSSSSKDPGTSTQQAATSHPPPSTRTEPPRTTSPAFVLSISINESSSSPPEITHQSRMSPVHDGEEANSSSSASAEARDADPLVSSSAVLDFTQSIPPTPDPPAAAESSSSAETRPDVDPSDDSVSEEEQNETHTVPASHAPRFRYRHIINSRLLSRSRSEAARARDQESRSNPSATRLGRRLVTQALSIRQRNAEAAAAAAAAGSSNSTASPSTSHSPSNSLQATLHSTAPVPISAGIRLGDSLTVFIQSERRGRPLFFFGRKKSPSGSPPVIHQPIPRLTHYIEELNVGRGFIKEVSFSSDGRLICSPFGFGVRLLSFDPNCSEMCDVIPSSPVKLYELTTNMSHTSAVVTTKFSPVHCLFVSGCLSGKVDFHQPLL